jgi:beta-phosphoglucomutase-like phosphatase (HAD superfamily)
MDMALHSEKTDGSKALAKALFYELEYVGADGQGRFFDSAKKVLKERDVALTRDLFSAYLLEGTFGQTVPSLLKILGRERLSADKLAAELREAAVKALAGVEYDAVWVKALKNMASRGVKCGAVSLLPAEKTEEMIREGGLAEIVGMLECAAEGAPLTPAAGSLVKLGRRAATIPSRCIAVVATSAARLAALTAGQRCVCLAGPFSGGHDFTGADKVVDDVKNLPQAVLEVLDSMGS